MNPALIPGEIVDPMRNDHARSEAREIMIKRFERLLTVHFAIAVQGAQELFLLGIDTQDWVVGLQELLDERCDMAKLCVAMRRVAAGQHRAHRASVARCEDRPRRLGLADLRQSLGVSNPSTPRPDAWGRQRCGS